MILKVDAKNFVSKSDMHSAMKAVLGEENYFGNNLDALHDCLTSICDPTVLNISNWSFAAKGLGGYANILWRVLCDSSEENPALKIIIE